MNQLPNIPVISVGISTQPEIHFQLHGNFTCPEFRDSLTGEYVARPSGNCLVLVKDGVTLETARVAVITPVDFDSSFTLQGVAIGVKFHWERREDQRFRGALKLLHSPDGITAINVVNVEDYLTSVISSEMSASCSLPFLKAHAVTSRSWLIAQTEKSRTLKAGAPAYRSSFESETERIRWYDREDHAVFDVCADDHCQRYQGITKAFSPVVEQAVRATRGEVLHFGGAVCDARFSKSCGGITETFENVWEPVTVPYLVPVGDSPSGMAGSFPDASGDRADQWIRSNPPAFCNTSDTAILSRILPRYDQETVNWYRWKVEYSQDELAEIICRKSGIDFGGIIDLIPLERGGSSRIIKLKIAGTKRTLTIGKELEIRRTLSDSHLYSSAFVIDTPDVVNGRPSRFILYGAGWGHGVGMCQIGAAVMGEQGYSHDQILAHYYPRTTLKRIY